MALKPHTHRISACYRHPAEPITGFCASCLRERLAGLDPSGHPETSSSSTATAFFSCLKHSGGGGPSVTSLRRSKSVSAGKCETSSGLSEPRRKSCDVRVRNTLAHLFTLQDKNNGLSRELPVESKNLGFSRLAGTVFEPREEDGNGEEIRVSEDVSAPNVDLDDKSDEEAERELKTMKEHIDLEWQRRKHATKDLRGIAGSFWVATSVFSKKLRKWKHNQKMKKRSSGNGGGVRGSCGGNGGNLLAMRADGSIGGALRDTQSEIADYGFGRRSCDTEPRFSVDAGMVAVENSRFSFDEHRVSWDGYLIARTIPRLTPMLSTIGNVMLAPVNRSDDHQILIDGQLHSIKVDDTTSGGSARTKDDYSDSSSSQRLSSFDRSSSVKSSNKNTLGLEADEVKSISNAKVSPATVDIFQETKLVITERELKDWHLNSLKDDHSENFEPVSKDDTFVTTGGNLNGFKKSNRWQKVCNMWGSIHRSGDKKYENIAGNVIDRPITEACERRSKEADGVVKVIDRPITEACERKSKEADGLEISSARSCSCVCSSCNMIGSYHSTRSVVVARGCAKKGTEEFLLDQNRSTRYSPRNFDNGLLRFYLTPLRSYRRSKSGKK